MRHTTIPALLAATLALIGSSNTLGGTALRASVALPLAQAGVISAPAYATFALDSHWLELPEPFGFPEHAQCVTDSECEAVYGEGEP